MEDVNEEMIQTKGRGCSDRELRKGSTEMSMELRLEG